MNNDFNMFQFMKNPEQAAINLLEQSAQSNPMMQNLLYLAKNKDTSSIEAIARNMAKEKGIDYDKEFNSFKHKFGL